MTAARKIHNIVSLFDLLVPSEEHEIAIGARALRRGAMLRSAAGGQKTVTIGSCGDCGLRIGQCSCAMSPPGLPPDSSVPNGITPTPGCYPRSSCDADGRFMFSGYLERLRNSRMRQAPYVDPSYDSIWMDTILSAITTVPFGTTVDIPLQPVAGTFALFYYEIVAVDPTTQVAQVDWRAGQPRIEGCPVPCGSGDVLALSQFVQKVPEACCGQPLVAWLDRPSEDTPLNTPFQNNQAAGDLLVQIRGRGYCCSTRIC